MSQYFAGLDIGGTKLLGVVIDDGGIVVAESRVPTPHGADALLGMIEQVVSDLGEVVGHIDAVGVGAPGLVTYDGLFRFAPNLIEVSELAVGELLAERFEQPVFVDNDANCAVWAERKAGAAKGVDDVVLVTLGTGIGTGAIVNGELHRGANGFAGEAGHIIMQPDGEVCPCGRRGCWETIASGRGLARMGTELVIAGAGEAILGLAGGDIELIRGEHVARAARNQDSGAAQIMDRFAWNVGLGIANISAIFDPELLLIGGGLVAELDQLIDGIVQAHSDLVIGAGHRPDLRIEPVALGERAGAMGAAILAGATIS